MAFKVGSIPVLQKSTHPVNPPFTSYTGVHTATTVLPKGHKKTHEHIPFKTTTIFDRDIPIRLRDGTIIRADVFRPQTEEKVPALLAWGPFGKSGVGLFSLDKVQGKAGVEKSMVPGYQTFGGLDPAEWTAILRCVDGPVVLELEEGPIASLTLGLLQRRRSSRQAAMMTTIQVMAIRTLAATMEILARPSRAV